MVRNKWIRRYHATVNVELGIDLGCRVAPSATEVLDRIILLRQGQGEKVKHNEEALLNVGHDVHS